MKFLSEILVKAGLVVDGVAKFNSAGSLAGGVSAETTGRLQVNSGVANNYADLKAKLFISVNGFYAERAGNTVLGLNNTAGGKEWYIASLGSSNADPGSIMFNNETDGLSPVSINNSSLKLKVDTGIRWTEISSTDSVTYTAGISVDAANRLQINTGTDGVYGDLKLNELIATSLVGSGTRMVVADTNGLLSTQAIPSVPVLSVFGRTGNVTAQSGDYTTAQVTESGNLYYTDVRARGAVSASGSLSYNSTTGVFSYTTPNTDGVSEGTTNLYFTDARTRAAVSQGTGITYNSSTGVITNAGVTSFNGFTGDITYTAPVTSVNGATGAVLLTTTNISEGSNLYFTNARSRSALSFTAGSGAYDSSTGVITIPTNTNQLTNGAGFISTISGISAGGELSGTYPNPTLVNSAVTGKVLTGLNVTGGSVNASDTILSAFGKVQNQINGLLGGSIFQTTWNASTNSPALTSSVGTKGYYYIVSVAGSTNLDGITDWQVGDWAIFDGSVWRKVDNTDAVVSVNGFTGAVSLTTANISESGNLYYTDARVRNAISVSGSLSYNPSTGVISYTQPTNISTFTNDSGYVTAAGARSALSFTAGSGAYNSSTGVITIPTNTNQLTNGAGYITGNQTITLSGDVSGSGTTSIAVSIGALKVTNAMLAGSISDDKILSAATWNAKQNALSGTGFLRFSGTTPSYITGTSSQFVKADGTLDGTSYATAASLSGYLPLSGGTLTGALNGTSLSMSGGINKLGTTDEPSSIDNITAQNFISAPNSNFGNALLIRTDGSGRGFKLISANFNNSTNTGTALSFGTDNIQAFSNGNSSTSSLKLQASGSDVLIAGATTDGTNKLIVNGGVKGTNAYWGSSSFLTSSSANILQVGNIGVIENVVGNQMLLSNNAYYDGGNWKYVSTAPASAIRFGSTVQGDISFHSAASGTAGTNITNWDGTDVKLYIAPSGNVGIGTISPNRLLELASGSGAVQGITTTTSGASILYGRLAMYSTAFSNAYIDYGGEIRSYSGAGVDYSDLRFYTANGVASAEKARIASDGTFLINTTTTDGTNKLILNGAMKALGDLGLGVSGLTGGGNAKWITTDGVSGSTYGGGLISSINGTAKGYVYSEAGFMRVQGATGEGVRLVSNNSTVALDIASSGAITAISSVTASSFSGAGTGLTGTAANLAAGSIGGFANTVAKDILNPVANGPQIRIKYNAGAADRYIDFGWVDNSNNFSSGLKIVDNTSFTFLGNTILHAGNYSNYAMKYFNGAGANDYNTLTQHGIYRNQGGANGPTAAHTTMFTAMQDGANYGWQLAASSSSTIYFRYKSTAWETWVTLLSDYTAPYAASMNQHVRTTDNVTFNQVTASSGFFDSDLRLKNIVKRDGDVVYFNWKNGDDKKLHIGYIAQEVQKTNPDQVKANESGFLSVNYTEILVEKVRALEKEVEYLKGKYGVQ